MRLPLVTHCPGPYPRAVDTRTPDPDTHTAAHCAHAHTTGSPRSAVRLPVVGQHAPVGWLRGDAPPRCHTRAPAHTPRPAPPHRLVVISPPTPARRLHAPLPPTLCHTRTFKADAGTAFTVWTGGSLLPPSFTWILHVVVVYAHRARTALPTPPPMDVHTPRYAPRALVTTPPAPTYCTTSYHTFNAAHHAPRTTAGLVHAAVSCTCTVHRCLPTPHAARIYLHAHAYRACCRARTTLYTHRAPLHTPFIPTAAPLPAAATGLPHTCRTTFHAYPVRYYHHPARSPCLIGYAPRLRYPGTTTPQVAPWTVLPLPTSL